MKGVRSWGRLSEEPHRCIPLRDPDRVDAILQHGPFPGLPYGMGRSYGDVCLNPMGTLWETQSLDHFIAFDESNGRMRCEAGVLLRDIQNLMMPKGWMLPVTPGTQWITVGGAIANDVHGKNHHIQGSFGDHVLSLTLARTQGGTFNCGPEERSDWFSATVGGLGLTGVITQAELQLKRIQGPWLDAETIPYQSLDEFFHLSSESESGWEHTVSWIDCLAGSRGKGLFMRANPASVSLGRKKEGRKVAMPITPPISLVNRLTLKPFNTVYYTRGKRKAGRSLVHYEPFFHPLDNLIDWNRMYGPKGFYQYQSVVPFENGLEATQEMLKAIQKAGIGSFLAVLKTFGEREAKGMLSFPRPGVTLALDFPNQGEKTLDLFRILDAIVHEAKGRLYPAKDARMPENLFRAGYPRVNEFEIYRDPGISSGFSRRVMGS